MICLDILRALAKEPKALDALIHEVRQGAGADRRLDTYISSVESDLIKLAQQRSPADSLSREGQARRLAEKLHPCPRSIPHRPLWFFRRSRAHFSPPASQETAVIRLERSPLKWMPNP